MIHILKNYVYKKSSFYYLLLALLLILLSNVSLSSCTKFTISEVILARKIDNANNQFEATNKFLMEEDVYCLVKYEAAPSDTEIKVVMKYSSNNIQFPSKEFFKGSRFISGTGTESIKFSVGKGKLFARGNYDVILTISDNVIKLPFQVVTPITPDVKIGRFITNIKDTGERKIRIYKWQYNDLPFELPLSLPKATYDYYKNRNIHRIPTTDPSVYSIYVTHPDDDEGINSLATYFNKKVAEHDLNTIEKINLIASFVQSLRYTSDNETTPYDEYPRYPIETLVDEGGDCEDTSILLASILKAMGFRVILVLLPEVEHCVVGIAGEGTGTYTQHNGVHYYLIETTGSDWKVGEFPPVFEGIHTDVAELIPRARIEPPSIHFEQVDDVIKLTVYLENLGTAVAENVSISAGFEYVDNEPRYQQETDSFSINYDYAATVTFYLDVLDISKENIDNIIVKADFDSNEKIWRK